MGEHVGCQRYVRERKAASSRRTPKTARVRDKIRQQLQVLRDLGLLEFTTPGHYHLLCATEKTAQARMPCATQCSTFLTKKEGATSPPLLKANNATSYLWPECVMRAMMSRRLSGTVAFMYSSRSAGVHLVIVALRAAAHLSMLSAFG